MARNAAPENETKAQKFARLATARVNASLDAMAKIEGLSAKGQYDYTPEQVESICKALEAGVMKIHNRFKNPSAVASSGFTISPATPVTEKVEPEAKK